MVLALPLLAVAQSGPVSSNAGNVTLQGDSSITGGGKVSLVAKGTANPISFQTQDVQRWSISSAGILANDATNGGNLTFSKVGTGILNYVYAPTVLSTPTPGTNVYQYGVNLIPPTATANHLAYLPTTPIVGGRVVIVNRSGASVKAKAFDTEAIMGNATLGYQVPIAAGSVLICDAVTTTLWACYGGTATTIPTPAA